MSVCSVGPRVGGVAVRIGACRKAEAVSPKANPPSGNLRNGRQKNQPAEGNLRSGACRKAEAVSPKATPLSGNSEAEGRRTNSPRVTPKRCVPKSGSGEPEGQPAEWQPRSGACRKAEAVSPKANPPSGNPEAARAEKRKLRTRRPTRRAEASTRRAAISEAKATPSGENHPRRAFAIRRSKSRNEGSAEQCRHTYQYNRKTRL